MFIRQLYQATLLLHSQIPIEIGRGGGGGGWGGDKVESSSDCSCVEITDSRLWKTEGWRDRLEREREMTGRTIFSSPLEHSLYISIKPSAQSGV